MLNTFPDLLNYSFFAPTLLRLVAALALAYIVYVQWQRREEIGEMRVPLIGKVGGLVWLAIVGGVAITLMFLAGYYTQIAALLTALLSIKHFIFAKKYARAIPLCRADYLFLLVICLSLLLTGAGALAMDLPL